MVTDSDPGAEPLPDPRLFPAPSAVGGNERAWHALAAEALAAPTGLESTELDRALRSALMNALAAEPASVARAIDEAPSPVIARHVWRALDQAFAELDPGDGGDLAVHVFALPVAIVAGLEGGETETTLPGLLRDPEAVAGVLRAGGALSGNQTLAISPALVRVEALAPAALPDWHALRQLAPNELGRSGALPFLVPAPMRVVPGSEAVHLRFLAGAALAGSSVDLLARPGVERWGVALTQELGRQLAVPGVSVLALPRPPARPLPAAYAGFSAQREVGAQLFVGNALRRFRASVGEPAAVVSAHRASDAAGGGELRVSLSSVFAARDAEGFRCPLHAIETVGSVVTMLRDLLHDCRVADVRFLPGVHPDRAGGSSMRLFFRADALPEPSRG